MKFLVRKRSVKGGCKPTISKPLKKRRNPGFSMKQVKAGTAMKRHRSVLEQECSKAKSELAEVKEGVQSKKTTPFKKNRFVFVERRPLFFLKGVFF